MYLNKKMEMAVSVLKTENVRKDQSKPSSMKPKFNTIGKIFQKFSKQIIFKTTLDSFYRSKDETKLRKIFRKT